PERVVERRRVGQPREALAQDALGLALALRRAHEGGEVDVGRGPQPGDAQRAAKLGLGCRAVAAREVELREVEAPLGTLAQRALDRLVLVERRARAGGGGA